MSQKEMETLQSEYDLLYGVRLPKESRGRVQRWGSCLRPQEIRSGAIIPDPNVPGCYLIDANTVQGLRQFRHAREVTSDDPQSEESTITIQGPGHIVVFQVKHWSSGQVFRWNRIGQRKGSRRSAESESKEARLSPADLISRIVDETTSREERRRAVIEAEVIAFPPEQIEALNSSLRQFIEQYRNSDNSYDVVAVGSAVRKYVMNMREEELETFHVLFDPSDTATMPFEVELELVKTVLWKLTAVPPEADDSLPELADRLMDRVESYLRPWMLLRENHAAVVQDAALSLLLLRSHHVPNLLRLLRELSMNWFADLLMRRGRWLQQDLEARFPQQIASRFVRDVRALEETLQRQPT